MSKTSLQFVKTGLISQADFNFLSGLDPSRTKKYLRFIVKSYVAGTNLDMLRSRISEYDTLVSSNLTKRNDINSFRTFAELDEYVQELNNKRSNREVKREIKREADIILDNEELFIVSPYSHKASCLYGAGTRWCTTARNSIHFERYYQNLITFYYIQVRSPILKQELKQDLWKVAVVTYPDRRLQAYDGSDRLIGSDKTTAYEADKLNNLFAMLGVGRAMFLPLNLDERITDYLLYRKRDTEMNLSGLGLTRIPDTIGEMVQLKTLLLSENSLKELPGTIGRLHNLRTLFLFHNKLCSLPESIRTMTGLQWLGLSGNPLSRKTITELKRKLPDTRVYMGSKKELFNSKSI